MSEFAPPPFPFVIIPLSKYNYRVTVLQQKFVSVLCLVIENRVYLTIIHDPQLFLNTYVSERTDFFSQIYSLIMTDLKFRSDDTDCTSTPNIRRILPRPLRTFPRRSHDPKGWSRKCRHRVRLRISPWIDCCNWQRSVTASFITDIKFRCLL